MKIFSYIRHGLGLKALEVEITLIPGLPQIQFLGLPDTLIKESVLRIKAALRQQGFELPPTRQILVHLKPSHIKKTSRGLDLAVAAGILWETGQIPPPKNNYVSLYGELSLKGEVITPDDAEEIMEIHGDLFLGSQGFAVPFPFRQISKLEDLKETEVGARIVAPEEPIPLARPPLRTEALVSEGQARMLTTVALGEHPTLLAGPAGSGKSSSAAWIAHLLRDPAPEELLATRRVGRFFGERISWRPVVAPHHSASHLAIIGGGVPPLPGEITRAHGGALILDEFLEYSPKVQDALREPLEKGSISLARSQKREEYPARFLLLATTNLCPCGQLVPATQHKCRCRLPKQRRYLERFSGPMLDRFAILAFSHEWTDQKREVRVESLLQRVLRGQTFALQARNQIRVNQWEALPVIEKTLSPFAKKNLFPDLDGSSFRRFESLIRVARTLADLEESTLIDEKHLQASLEWSVQSFQKLKKDLERFTN